jgi:membrane protease YdiL (CAAX protease family)
VRVVSFTLLFLAVLQTLVLVLPALATVPVPDAGVSAGLVAQATLLLVAALVAGWILLRWVDGRSIAALLWLAVPAAAEEAVFRGYPFRALLEGTGPAVAIGVTSVLFALVHGSNPNVAPIGLVNIALAGAMLGVAAWRTGSLWLATGLHLGWNWAIAGLLDLPVSGLDAFDPPLYDAVADGPEWVTGGAFGPEGGIAATLAVGLALVTTWRITGPGRLLGAPVDGRGSEGEDR